MCGYAPASPTSRTKYLYNGEWMIPLFWQLSATYCSTVNCILIAMVYFVTSQNSPHIFFFFSLKLSTLYIEHIAYSIYNVYCIMYIIYYIIYAIYYILYAIYYMLYAIGYMLYAICYMLYPISYILYAISYILYTIYIIYILYTIYYILYSI